MFRVIYSIANEINYKINEMRMIKDELAHQKLENFPD